MGTRSELCRAAAQAAGAAGGSAGLNRRRKFVDYGIRRLARAADQSREAGDSMTRWLSGLPTLASIAVALMAVAEPAHAEKRGTPAVGHNDSMNAAREQ